jgi:phosphoglycerate kinase
MSEALTLRSVQDAEVAGKRVLVRVDFNVPIQGGTIADDSRIKAAVPTLQFLLEHDVAEVSLMTHLGRPDGRVVEDLRTAPLLERLRTYVDSPKLNMLENLRFDPREEAGDDTFAKELATHGDLYVNEAFSNSHRSHASMTGVPKLLPSFAGLELIEEVGRLSGALTPPEGALAIIGGAKFETKQPLIEKLLKLYATILVGGALANDLLKARGWTIGASLTSDKPVPVELAGDERVFMPNDMRVDGGALGSRNANTADVRADEKIVDIGEATAAHWAKLIEQAPFVLWNGPMGVYEKGYVAGTDALAQALTNASCPAVVGGGDTEAAIKRFTFDEKRIFVSTGGGAMLEFLSNGGSLPATDVLKA